MLLKLISCGSLALVSVLVVTLLQGLRQHNQRIHALQERIDQLEERTPNRARGIRAAGPRTHPPHSGQSRARQRTRETDQDPWAARGPGPDQGRCREA